MTNDDGIGAPGIDTLVNAPRRSSTTSRSSSWPRPTNQSGSSDTTTPGGAHLRRGATASGVEGTAVDGFPADTIAVALDELGLEPDLVVSGVNEGQNVGPLAYVSGTVGAARAAIRRGDPRHRRQRRAREDDADYATAVELIVAYIDEHRAELADGSADTTAVVELQRPGLHGRRRQASSVEVPLATEIPEGVNPFASRLLASSRPRRRPTTSPPSRRATRR